MADKSKFPWLNVEFKHQESKPDSISLRYWLYNVILPLLIAFAIAKLLSLLI
jgi:hypothetical protein